MRLLKSFIVALIVDLAAASAIPRSLTKRDGRCDGSGPFVDGDIVGSAYHGEPFCETGWDTRPYPVTQISIWAGPQGVRGLQVTYADGYQSPVYGTSAGWPQQSMTIDYGTGELITEAKLTGRANGLSQLLRGISITTNKGQVVQGGNQTGDPTVPVHSENVGNGILYGMGGRQVQNGYIAQLGLYFLRSPIALIELTNLQFPSGPSGTAGILPDSLDDVHYYNNGGTATQNWQFSGNRQFTKTRMFSSTSANMISIAEAINIEAQTPIIQIVKAASTTTFTWAYTETDMNSATEQQVDNLAWQQSGTLDPGQGLDCSALIGTGGGTFPYTGSVTVSLEDGTQFSYTEGGTLQLNDVSSVAISCTPNNNP